MLLRTSFDGWLVGIFLVYKIPARTRIYDEREYKLVLEVTFYIHQENQLTGH